jgi:hypothetical protein
MPTALFPTHQKTTPPFFIFFPTMLRHHLPPTPAADATSPPQPPHPAHRLRYPQIVPHDSSLINLASTDPLL